MGGSCFNADMLLLRLQNSTDVRDYWKMDLLLHENLETKCANGMRCHFPCKDF